MSQGDIERPFDLADSRWSRRRLLKTGAAFGGIFALGGTAGLMAACSDDDDDDEPEPTGSATATPTEAMTSEATESPSGETVKVGILHSLSGTMAISEVSVKDAELLAIDEINAAGGVLGMQIEPIIEDGQSDWPTFAEKARKLIQSDGVACTFGCWTSASRKAVLPVYEDNEALLFYPVQYEGLEASPYIYYMGATTNQQIVPSVEYLLDEVGMTKFFLLGSDYVFPRTANQIIRAQLDAAGAETVAEEYTPLGHTDYLTVISKIREAEPDVVYNTLNGDSNTAFFKQLRDAGFGPDDMPTLSVSVAEEEVRGIGADVMAGHLTAWNYYQTVESPENEAFVAAYKAAYGENRVTADPHEAAYIGVYLWSMAVEKAGTTEVEAVREAMKGLTFQAPEGLVTVNGENQHISKTVRIGKIREDGLIDTIFATDAPVEPDPYLETYEWASEFWRT